MYQKRKMDKGRRRGMWRFPIVKKRCRVQALRKANQRQEVRAESASMEAEGGLPVFSFSEKVRGGIRGHQKRLLKWYSGGGGIGGGEKKATKGHQ